VSVTRHRARIAALSRGRAPDDSELLEARRALAVERVEQLVTQALTAAPPLTEAQRAGLLDRLSSLLGPASGGAR